MPQTSTYQQKLADKVFYYGLTGALGLYHTAESPLRWVVERSVVTNYDDSTTNFIGGEMETLTHRNYEKAFANLWKAQEVAPYLGFKDASAADRTAAAHGVVVGSADPERGAKREAQQIEDLVEIATSEEVRREFREHYDPEQREAVMEIMSLLAHGEAYALYTSSTLLPMVRGTGSKLGMAMQVMEEAKHFSVLREMLRTLDGVRPLRASARMLFENIARQRYYNKLFGMNIVLESAATNLFSHFEDFPGLRHIMRAFHMDESRHVAFPQNYAAAGNIPARVTDGWRYQWSRLLILSPAAPLFMDYKPYFDVLGIDAYAFWGRFLAKVTRAAEKANMPLPFPRKMILSNVNFFFNSYVKAFEPERYKGFQDYTLIYKGDISEDMAGREREVFGKELFGLARGERRKRSSRAAKAKKRGLVDRVMAVALA